MRPSPSTALKSIATGSTPTCAGSSCGSTRRNGARSNRSRSTSQMRSRDRVRPFGLALAAAVCLTGQAAAGEQREEVTRLFDRTLTVTGLPTLHVEHRIGEVRVRAHAGNELRIQATIHVSGDSRAEASAMADAIRIEVQDGPGMIGVTTRYPESLLRESQ